MPTVINDLTNSYLKVERCLNAVYNSSEYRLHKSYLTQDELDCLKHLQKVKRYHVQRRNREAKQNSLIGFINNNDCQPAHNQQLNSETLTTTS